MWAQKPVRYEGLWRLKADSDDIQVWLGQLCPTSTMNLADKCYRLGEISRVQWCVWVMKHTRGRKKFCFPWEKIRQRSNETFTVRFWLNIQQQIIDSIVVVIVIPLDNCARHKILPFLFLYPEILTIKFPALLVYCPQFKTLWMLFFLSRLSTKSQETQQHIKHAFLIMWERATQTKEKGDMKFHISLAFWHVK
jgi:hypothetical protein